MTAETNRTLRRLGKKVRAMRNEARLSAAALAAKAKTSAGHLTAVERGERSASLLCLVRIATALNTTIETLLEGVDASRTTNSRP